MFGFIVLVAGLIVLISLLPLIWKVAKGLAKILLTILIFCLIVGLLWKGLLLLSAAL